MLAGTERDRLLGALGELLSELGYAEERGETEAMLAASESVTRRAFAGMLSEEEEGLVAAIREALTKVASAVAPAQLEGATPPPSAIVGALGGFDFVMRGEIMAGRAERLPALVPGFAYLVTLPLAGEEEALRVSRRAGELVGV